ncbi:hypothetical protein ACQEV4_21765 [Streptomyces shenzhenensis]|uniref:hypothetical protein n=1 Tax=Streptomyces shenzhenensis TaxID=943815 RepID=UPI003D8D0F19
MTARLQNAAGRFVAPGTAGLLAAQAAMKPSGAGGVVEPDPTTKSAAAYPLTLLTYAATVPEDLTKQEGRDYAALLRYVVGAGQRPGVAAGTLPEGYAALPGSVRAATRAAADAIAARAGTSAAGPGSGGGDSAGGTGSGSGSGSTGGGAGGTGAGGAGTAGGPAGTGHGDNGSGATGAKGASPAASVNPSGSPSTAPAASGAALPDTPEWALGAVRYALLIALVTGLAAAVCGPVLPTVVPRLAAGVAAWRARDKTSGDPGR